MKTATAPASVPFHQCRQGAIVEFEVFPSKPVQGTVACLRVYGPRNFLVEFSQWVDEKGVLRTGPNRVTQMPETINLFHAKRVVQHSTGPLVFAEDTAGLERMFSDITEGRRNGTIRRCGKRLVIDGQRHWAPGLLRELVMEYVMKNETALGVLPWENLDFQALQAGLLKAGIARLITVPMTVLRSSEPYPVRAELHLAKMKRYVKRNINRLKLDTRALRKEQDRLDDEYEQEQLAREMEDGRLYA